jgi:FO synthase
MCKLVLEETGLLPHANPGVMSRDELAALREVTASQGIMLETVSDRLSERGGPHFGSPDKRPAARLETIRLAGELRVPFTTGILIGIGETRAERIEALEAIAALHREHGHVQEVIVQNFRAKPGTKMAAHPEPALDDLLWTAAVARLVLPPDVHVQVPPNLSCDDFPRLLDAGIDDWGGVSPVTIDHVNPRRRGPRSSACRSRPRRQGWRSLRACRQRTTLYGTPAADRLAASFGAAPLAEPVNPPVDTARLRRPATLVRPGLAVA